MKIIFDQFLKCPIFNFIHDIRYFAYSQSTGKLLVTCGPTMHLFYQIYTRNNHGKSSYFMDFLPFVEVFQLDFLPIEVVISENIIASYSQEFVSVFKVKKCKVAIFMIHFLILFKFY